MTTTVTKTIGSGGGRDYSTLALWEAGLPANLVTGDTVQIGQCFNDSEFTSASALVVLAGSTTDATHTITLTTGTGQSFRDNANVQTNALKYNQSNGVGIRCSGGYTAAVDVQDNNVFVSNLQISGSGGTQSVGLAASTTNSNVTIDYCVLENTDAVTFFTASLIVRNTLIVGRKASLNPIWTDAGTGTSGHYDFCTFVVPSSLAKATNGFQKDYGSTTLKSCAFFGCTNVDAGSGTRTFTTCYTDDASPPTGCTTATYANQFQNTADSTRDFRSKTGADLIGNGTADSTNGATDIAGTTRPQGGTWDVGAWELVSAVTFTYFPMVQPEAPFLFRKPEMQGY